MPNDQIIVPFGDSAYAFDGIYDIFGTDTGTETVTVMDNTIAYFQSDFSYGGDTIRLLGNATDFTIQLSGSNAILTSAVDGITVNIPVGTAGLSVVFQDSTGSLTDARNLVIDGTDVVLDGQILTSTATAVDPAPAPSAFSPDPVADTLAVATVDEAGTAATIHAGGGALAHGAAESGLTAFIANFA